LFGWILNKEFNVFIDRNMMGEELALLKVGELHDLEHNIECAILKVRARQVRLSKFHYRFSNGLLGKKNTMFKLS